MNLAREVAGRVGVPFLVVDVAQTVEGKWIVIECNDGQEADTLTFRQSRYGTI